MGFFATVWVVLMLIWLLFGCYLGYSGAPAGQPNFGPILSNTIIPWACVAILGYILLNGAGGGTAFPH